MSNALLPIGAEDFSMSLRMKKLETAEILEDVDFNMCSLLFTFCSVYLAVTGYFVTYTILPADSVDWIIDVMNSRMLVHFH